MHDTTMNTEAFHVVTATPHNFLTVSLQFQLRMHHTCVTVRAKPANFTFLALGMLNFKTKWCTKVKYTYKQTACVYTYDIYIAPYKDCLLCVLYWNHHGDKTVAPVKLIIFTSVRVGIFNNHGGQIPNKASMYVYVCMQYLYTVVAL